MFALSISFHDDDVSPNIKYNHLYKLLHYSVIIIHAQVNVMAVCIASSHDLEIKDDCSQRCVAAMDLKYKTNFRMKTKTHNNNFWLIYSSTSIFCTETLIYWNISNQPWFLRKGIGHPLKNYNTPTRWSLQKPRNGGTQLWKGKTTKTEKGKRDGNRNWRSWWTNR